MRLANSTLRYDPKAPPGMRYIASVLVESDDIGHSGGHAGPGPHEALAAAIREAGQKHMEVLINECLKKLEIRL